jgi:hypothetical protein
MLSRSRYQIYNTTEYEYVYLRGRVSPVVVSLGLRGDEARSMLTRALSSTYEEQDTAARSACHCALH